VTEAPVVFSIVSANYLAYAITLMQSVRQHHPAAHRYVFLADDAQGDLGLDPTLFTLVPVAELGIPHPDHFAFRYSVLEFNTAIKPFAARWLAERYPAEPVIYLDPDILVVSPLVEVLAATSSGALAVIAPHLTAPLTDDKRPDEQTFLRVGTYNLGFIALGPHPDRRALIDWWAAKLERLAYVDLEAGLFTDQKWIDLVPGLFPDVTILRHPGYDLAYWNLAHRPVTTGPDGAVLADGRPIAFVHFSGVDIRNPGAFSIHQNRYDAEGIGGLRDLYGRYLALLSANGYDRFSRLPYAWARLRDGTPITAETRAIFRHRFDVGRPDEVADPFGLSSAAFAEPVSLPDRVVRYFWRQYPRFRAWAPFRLAMNRVGPNTRWAIRRFMSRRSTPPSIRAAEAARTQAVSYPTTRPSGLGQRLGANVIGYLRGEFGVAENARSLIAAAATREIDLAFISIRASETRENDLRYAGEIGEVAPNPVNLIVVNPDQIELVMDAGDPGIYRGRYNIGVWAWELERFPPAWLPSIDRVDEIWVGSSFEAASIGAVTNKSVRVVRMAVDPVVSRPYSKSEFQLPADAFVFLFSFDFNSYVARKNPQAVIGAFKAAFSEGDERVALVIKTTNGARKSAELDRLHQSTRDDPRIIVRDGFMSRDEMYGLQSVADAYVSLHRSEGFGLGLAECMALGKPVIGTGYSGNMEFMNPGNSCVVSYRLIDVQAGEYPYPEGQVWAEPDLQVAAFHMRRLVDDPAYAQDLGRRAQQHMTREFSADAIGARIAAELGRVMDSATGPGA
jgi:glycosyltransferase involved in cell wall biosynthesis